MKKFLLSLLFANFTFAQTKLIAYKSHSGSRADFENAVTANFADTNDSNLGIVVRTIDSKVDSVVFLNNDKAVVVRREKYDHSRYNRIIKDTFQNKSLRNKSIDSVKKILSDERFPKEFDSTKFFKKTKTGELKPLQPAPAKKEIQQKPAKKHPELALLLIIPLCAGLYSWRKL